MVDYNLNVLGGFDLGAAAGRIRDRFDEHDRKEEAKTERARLNKLMKGAASGDSQSIADLYGENIQYAQFFEQRKAQRAANANAVEAKRLDDVENDFFVKYKSILNSGDQAQIEALEQSAISNPDIDFDEEDRSMPINQKKALNNVNLYQSIGKDAYQQFYGEKNGKAGLPAETVAFNELIKDFTPEQKMKAKQIKAGLKGRAMSNAVLSAVESGDIKNLADAKAMIKESEKFAEMTGSSRAKAIDKGLEKITKIDQSVSNFDRALDALNKGAGVGAVERLWPSIKASSVLLDNIRGDMALDVVGATTFGALSKGELDLAKDVALPTGLDTEQLKKYLTDKKAAQSKLRNYYNEQIQHLDQGGTVASFLRKKEREQAPSIEPAEQAEKQGGQLMIDANGNKAIVYSDGTFKEVR